MTGCFWCKLERLITNQTVQLKTKYYHRLTKISLQSGYNESADWIIFLSTLWSKSKYTVWVYFYWRIKTKRYITHNGKEYNNNEMSHKYVSYDVYAQWTKLIGKWTEYIWTVMLQTKTVDFSEY